MEIAWVRLDARFKDEGAFIKDLMQDIRIVSTIKDRDDERLIDYYVMLQLHQTARPCSGVGASLGDDLCKAPSGSQVLALQEGKLNFSPPSLPGVAAGMADVQPAVGVSFPRMGANQASCPSTLQATCLPP
jgi:hypothetical protein